MGKSHKQAKQKRSYSPTKKRSVNKRSSEKQQKTSVSCKPCTKVNAKANPRPAVGAVTCISLPDPETTARRYLFIENGIIGWGVP